MLLFLQKKKSLLFLKKKKQKNFYFLAGSVVKVLLPGLTLVARNVTVGQHFAGDVHMKLLPVAVVLAGLSAPAFAQSADDAALAPVKAFVAAINDGSIPAAQAAMTASATITDEFAPFHWEGKSAVSDWMKGDDADAKAHGVTDGAVSIGKPLHVSIEGGHGYAVVPMIYAYKQNGKPVTETALFTVSLVQTDGKWLMSSWTYGLK